MKLILFSVWLFLIGIADKIADLVFGEEIKEGRSSRYGKNFN